MTDLILPPSEMQALQTLAQMPIAEVEKTFLQVPQAECPVQHHFGPGVYIREVHLPAGIMAISHEHRHSHTNLFLSGKLNMYNDDGTFETMEAPMLFVSPPGRKLGYILTPCVWQNIYATEETDLAKLEELLFVKSDGFKSAAATEHVRNYSHHIADRRDFRKVLRERWLDERKVREMSENPNDQIPFPQGSYKVTVAPSAIEGQGLFATANFQAGEIIAPARIGASRTPAGRYTNHSVCPNAQMVRTPAGNINLVARLSIAGCRGGSPGDEITIDYRDALRVAATFEEQT